ncbi:SDR family oxidoreductase [Microbulbifer thermotolerans]|nr:SDR family oxidoreductase [Microbulbifer thermotolerans]MCX2831684.1 SDR family oxidoreductase [Microbulbifer thermotolerans]MCX2841933.1 SDR family oxidoreductase [Microbulbifer thermotolerans]SFB93222.1 UDP-glucose 4-epimerase [Microbulbifer thermotolerans]
MNSDNIMTGKRVLITGAAGYIGHQLGALLVQEMPVVGVDIRTRPAPFPIFTLDICDPALGELLRAESITHVVHLASVMAAGRDREAEYRIDVEGTENLLKACLYAGVEHITVASSGAAYGYYPDNPEWLDEQHPLRGNPEFGYSDNKRRVEEMLVVYREKHPRLKQLIFRPCSIVGAATKNKIGELFSGGSVLDPGGHNSPFVFVWDQDVIRAIEFGVRRSASGIYNLAGDGALTPEEIARLLKKPLRRPPVWLVKLILGIGYFLHLTDKQPGQVIFLQYRPVLSNRRLKEELGFVPQKSSRQAFVYFAREALGIEPWGDEVGSGT